MGKNVWQFKIILEEITPPIWRRILVPETYDFWELHVAIQDSMGWMDCHLHAFRFDKKHSGDVMEIGIPDPDDDMGEDDPKIIAGWDIDISDGFPDVGATIDYDYDFGDGWSHKVILEAIIPREKGERYPKCIGGARACPPEDCGGVYGYYNLLKILSNPKHKEYKEMAEWLGGKYDPEEFDPQSVVFDNPQKRLEWIFGEF